MTVLIYVDTGKQIGDPEHLKVFANADAAAAWFAETIPKAWRLSTRFWTFRLEARTLLEAATSRWPELLTPVSSRSSPRSN